MNIKEFCGEAGMILAEQAGAVFTGKTVFEVNMRRGQIMNVNVTRSSEMKADPEPPEQGERVPRFDRPADGGGK